VRRGCLALCEYDESKRQDRFDCVLGVYPISRRVLYREQLWSASAQRYGYWCNGANNLGAAFLGGMVRPESKSFNSSGLNTKSFVDLEPCLQQLGLNAFFFHDLLLAAGFDPRFRNDRTQGESVGFHFLSRLFSYPMKVCCDASVRHVHQEMREL